MLWKQFCNITTVVLGSWHLGPKLGKSYDPWKACPNTLAYVRTQTHNASGTDVLSDQPAKYSCLKKPFKIASYEPYDCSLLSLPHALDLNGDRNISRLRNEIHDHTATKSRKQSHALSSKSTTDLHREGGGKKKRIVYVGDSLITQSYITAACLLEQHRIQDVEVSYVGDVFLRHDIPCDPRCINNATMYMPYVGSLRNPCYNCPDGKPRTWQAFLTLPHTWPNRLPSDTVALVIGGGTWYNGFKGIFDSAAAFLETVTLMKPVLHSMIHDRNITVFWQGLVPMIPEHLEANNLTFMYEWAFFDDKDRVARSVLEPIGVNFINVSALTKERKQRDPAGNADPIHWCSPGLHSVPAMVNHVIFHVLRTVSALAT